MGSILERNENVAWDALKYMKFIAGRTRCSNDLLIQVPLKSPATIVDLGCGPGNSTELLMRRFPDSKVYGQDSSADMIRLARESYPDIDFEVSDLQDFAPKEEISLYFAGMVFQWVPGHQRLPTIKRLMEGQPKGGCFAMCMPDPYGHPFHEAMVEIAKDGPWADILQGHKTTYDIAPTPTEVYAALKPICSEVDVWHIYQQNHFADHEEAVECFSQTGLRPFLAPLDETMKAGFMKQYANRLKKHYPAQHDGSVLLGFPTLYVMLTKA